MSRGNRPELEGAVLAARHAFLDRVRRRTARVGSRASSHVNRRAPDREDPSPRRRRGRWTRRPRSSRRTPRSISRKRRRRPSPARSLVSSWEGTRSRSRRSLIRVRARHAGAEAAVRVRSCAAIRRAPLPAFETCAKPSLTSATGSPFASTTLPRDERRLRHRPLESGLSVPLPFDLEVDLVPDEVVIGGAASSGPGGRKDPSASVAPDTSALGSRKVNAGARNGTSGRVRDPPVQRNARREADQVEGREPPGGNLDAPLFAGERGTGEDEAIGSRPEVVDPDDLGTRSRRQRLLHDDARPGHALRPQLDLERLLVPVVGGSDLQPQ